MKNINNLQKEYFRNIIMSVISEHPDNDSYGVDYDDNVMEADPETEIIQEFIPISEDRFDMNDFNTEMEYWKRVVMDAVQNFLTAEAKKVGKTLTDLDVDGTMFNTLVSNVMLELKEL